jgi:hypothetical protein
MRIRIQVYSSLSWPCILFSTGTICLISDYVVVVVVGSFFLLFMYGTIRYGTVWYDTV